MWAAKHCSILFSSSLNMLIIFCCVAGLYVVLIKMELMNMIKTYILCYCFAYMSYFFVRDSFRPAYGKLDVLVSIFPNIPHLATSATATLKSLGGQNPSVEGPTQELGGGGFGPSSIYVKRGPAFSF